MLRYSNYLSAGFFYLAVALVFMASFALPVSAEQTTGDDGGGSASAGCRVGKDCTSSCNGGTVPSPCTGSCFSSNCGCFANSGNSGAPVTCSCDC
jgi:hypothetical protein